MTHGREYWSRQVAAWRRSGLSQKMYCEKHGVVKGTLGCWASKLGRESAVGTGLVEVGSAERAGDERFGGRPIEVVVGQRYVVRLWSGTDRDHVHEVLSLLEQRG